MGAKRPGKMCTHPAMGKAVKYFMSSLRLSLRYADAPMLESAPHDARRPGPWWSARKDQMSPGGASRSERAGREGM